MLRTEDGRTVIKKNFFPLVLLTLIALLSCGQKVNSVILDTDIGSSTDDLFAMQLLYHYADSKEIKLIGIIVDREGQENAYLADLMNTYYGYEEVPIGLVKNGIKNPKVWIDYKKLPEWKNKNADKTEEKNLIFPYTCYDESYPDGYKLYRELLASQPDKSVVVCSIGFLTCLSQLLKSQADEYSDLNGVELVKRKVKAIDLMARIDLNNQEMKSAFWEEWEKYPVLSRIRKWWNNLPVHFEFSPVGIALSNAYIHGKDPLVPCMY